MLQLKTYKSFKSISASWKRLYDITTEVSPFLSYEAMKIAVKYFYPYYITRKCLPLFCVFSENDKVRAIVPLLRYSNGKCQLFGDVNGFNESGILYDSVLILPECLQLLRERLGSVEFMKIDARSPLAKNIPAEAISTSNAAITFPKDYDEYFKGLSKSVRQNIRTAYNRINADGLSIEFRLYKEHELPVDQVIDLYCQRHGQRYGVKTGRLKKWFLKSQSFATRYYRFAPNAMTFILYIDKQPAAFLSGLSAGNRLVVPRLSIDDKFRRYSPGMLLVIETIKFLQQHSSIEVLDLSQGDEAYKYQLGACQHLSYRFFI